MVFNSYFNWIKSKTLRKTPTCTKRYCHIVNFEINTKFTIWTVSKYENILFQKRFLKRGTIKKIGKDIYYSLWKLETRVIKDQHFVFLLTSYVLKERKTYLYRIVYDNEFSKRWSEDESQTLMVDPQGEVYLIGNIYNGRGMVSHLPSSAWGSGQPANIETTQFLPIHTHHHDPVSGDISPDGSEILIKSKSNIFYWKVDNGDVMASLMKPPVEVPYHQDGLGEAICFSSDGQNYYIVPEGHNPPLYVYTRLHGQGGSGGSSSVIGK